jgi:thiamine biosynthesis protein ThiS
MFGHILLIQESRRNMQIVVNGEKRSFASPLTVYKLLEQLGINPKSVAVERNLKIVARGDFERDIIDDGDTIEIIRMVGGG